MPPHARLIIHRGRVCLVTRTRLGLALTSSTYVWLAGSIVLASPVDAKAPYRLGWAVSLELRWYSAREGSVDDKAGSGETRALRPTSTSTTTTLSTTRPAAARSVGDEVGSDCIRGRRGRLWLNRRAATSTATTPSAMRSAAAGSASDEAGSGRDENGGDISTASSCR